MQLLIRSDPSLSYSLQKAKEICPVWVGAGSVSAELPFISFGPTVWPRKPSFICQQITPDLYITIKKKCLVQIQTHLSKPWSIARHLYVILCLCSGNVRWIVFCSLVSADLFTTWGFPSRDLLQVRVLPAKALFKKCFMFMLSLFNKLSFPPSLRQCPGRNLILANCQKVFCKKRL